MSEMTFNSLITNIERYLEYQRDEGIQRLEVERSVLLDFVSIPETELEDPAKVVVNSATVPEHFASLKEISEYVSVCRRCSLCQSRSNTVFGEGNTQSPDIMFIGEGPSFDEDLQGHLLVGKVGELFSKMIAAMGYTRNQVYISNVVKCYAPNNRLPQIEEMTACLPYLQQQVDFIKPKIIVGFGAVAIKGLLGKTAGISRLRGTWQEYAGIPMMPTFHPSYLLRNPIKKRDVWQDLQQVLLALGKELPTRNP